MILDAIKAFFTEQVLLPLAGMIATAIVGWIATWYTKLTKRELEARHRDALQSAIENGIRSGIQIILEGKLAADGTVPAAKRQDLLQAAKDYVVSSVPDAVKHFNLSEQSLFDLILPHLPNSNDKVKTS